MFNVLLYFAKPETKFWVVMVVLFILGLGYLANKLTRGITTGYIYYKMRDGVKNTLVLIHGFGSLILALALPNNFLNEIDFIKILYEENELWIAGSILVLLLSFLILFGAIFTFFAKLTGLEKLTESLK